MATVSSSVVIEGFDVRYALHFSRAEAHRRCAALAARVEQFAT
jgi:hypothetical protein